MKLVNLNIGIKVDNSIAVSNFLKDQNADIITLQEVTRHFDETVLPMYRSKDHIDSELNTAYPFAFFGPLWITDAFRINGKNHRDFGGFIEQGNYLLSKYEVRNATNEFYYKSYSWALDWTNWYHEDHGRAVQVVELFYEGVLFQILNVHGIWTKDKKGDERTIHQCMFLLNRAKEKSIPTIIVGDLNLLPDTVSIDILNKEFKNLISEYKIQSTRPKLVGDSDEGEQVVDYIYVNDGIKVDELKIIDEPMSDHLPMVLEFHL